VNVEAMNSGYGLHAPIFTVTDLKQYHYCPRILYFTYVQPVPRSVTHAMKRGTDEHALLDRLMPRRTVRRYGLDEAEKHFHVRLGSPTVGITGQLDLLLNAGDRYYPVEFKYTRQPPAANHRLQLSAYALLVEEEYETQVEMGFFLIRPEDLLTRVPIGEEDREAVRNAIGEIRQIVLAQQWPEGTRQHGKCVMCEWRNFCNDVR